jgi:glutamine transport system substrate-binding protein
MRYTCKKLVTAISFLGILVPGVSLMAVPPPLYATDQPALRAVTDPSFVPFEMLDRDSGEMVGFDMDILDEVASRAGFEYSLKTMSFNGIIPALQTGNVNIAIAGITITNKRGRIVDFSDPYYDSGLRLLVPASDNSITNIDDLDNRRVACKIGSTSYDFLQKHLGDKAEIVPYPDGSDMYLALMSGSVAAVLFDAPNVAYFAKTRGRGRVKTVGPLYAGQQYGIALVKGSPWLAKVNAALAAMRKDGSYARIYEKWFGKAPD